jgi:hypothetical protein
MAEDRIKLYDKDGNETEVWAVDARELQAGGDYTTEPPPGKAEDKKPEPTADVPPSSARSAAPPPADKTLADKPPTDKPLPGETDPSKRRPK